MKKLMFLILLLTGATAAQDKPLHKQPWVYTKSFHRGGNFTFMTSTHKVYETVCYGAIFTVGKPPFERRGVDRCLNTLSSVSECTPGRGFSGNALAELAAGYPTDTNTIAYETLEGPEVNLPRLALHGVLKD